MFRLLICDDHPPIRTALRFLARESSQGECEITECASAEELLLVIDGGNPFDFLTLDLQLPGRSAMEVLAEVKQLRPTLPVMIFSADESPERVTEALQAGASSYLFKSASEQALREALRAASAHRSAQRHQRSPADSPANPYSGGGVDTSLPTHELKARNSSVISAQTVWTPASSAPVSQHPLR